jgi:hypothetical protein
MISKGERGNTSSSLPTFEVHLKKQYLKEIHVVSILFENKNLPKWPGSD